jgi:hypothetical protein
MVMAATLSVPSQYGTIQAAINAANPAGGDVIEIAAGTYVENLVVTNPVELAGAGAGATIIEPALSAPNPCTNSSLCGGTASNIILVQANNVTIHDMTLDGDNPNLTSGIEVNGADIDARNGIITNHAAGVYNNLTIYNCTVKNIYLRGIYASSGGTFYIHDNTVDNVAADAQSIAIMNFGGGGPLTDGSGHVSSFVSNHVSNSNDGIVSNYSMGTQYLNNTVTTSGSGVHTDNNGVNGGTADLIEGNTVSNNPAGGAGGYSFSRPKWPRSSGATRLQTLT